MDAVGTAAGSTQDAGETGAAHGPECAKRDRRGQDRPRVRAPRPRGYDRHGLTALKRTVATLGGRVLDGRFAVARELREWRAGLERDLGGDLSTQERVLVDLATTTKLLLRSNAGIRQPPRPFRPGKAVPIDALSTIGRLDFAGSGGEPPEVSDEPRCLDRPVWLHCRGEALHCCEVVLLPERGRTHVPDRKSVV